MRTKLIRLTVLSICTAVLFASCEKEETTILNPAVSPSQEFASGPSGSDKPQTQAVSYWTIYGVEYDKIHKVSSTNGSISDPRKAYYQGSQIYDLRGIAQVPGSSNQFVVITGNAGGPPYSYYYRFFTVTLPSSGDGVAALGAMSSNASQTTFYPIEDIEFNPSNNSLYGIMNNQLIKITNYQSGHVSFTTIISSLSATTSSTGPFSLSFDQQNNVYLYGSGSGKITKYSLTSNSVIGSGNHHASSSNLNSGMCTNNGALFFSYNYFINPNGYSYFRRGSYASSVNIGSNNSKDLTSNPACILCE